MDAFAVVPASEVVHQDWPVACEHGTAALEKRIPLRWIQSLDSRPEQTPIFHEKNWRTTRPCFDGTPCFRAVRDDFATPEELHELWRGIEPQYGRQNDNGEHFIGIQDSFFRRGLLPNITGRMARFLETEMGARGVVVSHTNSRGEWRFHSNLTRGREQADGRRSQMQRGTYRGRRGHIDAARPVEWHYTCLLYVGEHEPERFAGGETVLVDTVDTRGHLVGGLVVEPRRGRLLAFTSGSENVHTALEATYGYRGIMQIWFACLPRKPAPVLGEKNKLKLEVELRR